MRSPGVVVLVFSILGLAGCTSTGSVDDLVPRPSNAVTSSISKPASPVPDAEVGDDAGVAVADVVTDAVEEAATESAAVMPGEKPELPAETTALVAPAKPVAANAVLKPSKVYRYGFRDAKPINFGKAS